MHDTAILIAAYGAARDDADAGCRTFAAEAARVLPGCRLAFASTSAKVRERLAGLGRTAASPAEALARLREEGARRVAVQSLHVIPGQEYCGMLDACRAAQEGAARFDALAVGGPLLGDEADLLAAARALPGYIPGDRAPDEAVVLVGHGSEADGAAQYAAFLALAAAADPLLRLGLLTGGPGAGETAADLAASGVRSVCLLPFMCAPGHHVREDIAGEGPASWRSVFSAAGLRVRAVIAGASEHPGFRAIWLAHLRAALARIATV